MQAVKLYVNGEERELVIDPIRSLLAVLRDELQLHGTKEGCGTGYCGACTVLVDGQPVNACLYFAVDADHREVTTIEGLEDESGLHPVQSSFIEHGGLQCGFCTPGMLMAASALLSECAEPSEAQVRNALAGNLCRCTGYQAIVTSVLVAARRLREDGRAGQRPGRRAPVRSRA
jgi:aerobic carbon-monoxide dehydrogenase small subunit